MLYDLVSSTTPNKSSVPTPSEAPIASTSQQAATSSQQGNKDIIDFFSAIDEEHPTTSNPQNKRYAMRLPRSKMTYL